MGARVIAGASSPEKLALCRAAEAADGSGEKYVVVNGGEDEPGSHKDRILLTYTPQAVLEGTLRASETIGPSQQVFFEPDQMNLTVADQYGFVIASDECYSEIYTREAPLGALDVASRTPERFRNLVVFNSLSKRSNLPGMRSGFCAGDGDFLETLAEIRNIIGQQPGSRWPKARARAVDGPERQFEAKG